MTKTLSADRAAESVFLLTILKSHTCLDVTLFRNLEILFCKG